MGTREIPWQDTDYVLRMFAKDTAGARKAYHSYVESALGEGRREDLSGGGLVRSLGGWTGVVNAKQRTKGDERILGGADFVMSVLREAREHMEHRFRVRSSGHTLDTLADMIAVAYGINRRDVLSKGREAPRVEARSLFCHIASRDLGVPVTDLARLLGMTPSAVTYAVRRGGKAAEERDFKL